MYSGIMRLACCSSWLKLHLVHEVTQHSGIYATCVCVPSAEEVSGFLPRYEEYSKQTGLGYLQYGACRKLGPVSSVKQTIAPCSQQPERRLQIQLHPRVYRVLVEEFSFSYHNKDNS